MLSQRALPRAIALSFTPQFTGTMASNLFASGLSKVAHGTEGKKVADLATDTKNYQDSNNRETSDWLVQQTPHIEQQLTRQQGR